MSLDRRELLQQTVGVVAGVAAGRIALADQAPAAPPTDRFFPGFKPFTFQTSGATINGVIGGSGPPVLLLHGAPQTHLSWRIVAPRLAANYTVVATDLRGYGDSSKPPDGENHANYSKRAMALDQVEVMHHFGFDRFPVIGHDRGGRVGHRMALDHADKVTKVSVLDIIPTSYIYTHVTIEFVQAYFHWFNYLRPAPGPEKELEAATAAQKARATTDVQIEYLRTSSTPENIHAMCEDYRAGASIDLKHDAVDVVAKGVSCPLLVLWGERSPMGRLYDVLAIWREFGKRVTGKGLPGGHNLQEDVPDQMYAEVAAFLKA